MISELWNVAVIGAGAWGTAFALQLAANGHKVGLWVYEPELVRSLRDTRENAYYLPGFRLPEGIEFTDDLKAAVESSSDIVIATPSFALRLPSGKSHSALRASACSSSQRAWRGKRSCA